MFWPASAGSPTLAASWAKAGAATIPPLARVAPKRISSARIDFSPVPLRTARPHGSVRAYRPKSALLCWPHATINARPNRGSSSIGKTDGGSVFESGFLSVGTELVVPASLAGPIHACERQPGGILDAVHSKSRVQGASAAARLGQGHALPLSG